MPVILATQEAEVRGLQFKASAGKSTRSCLQNKLKQKEWGVGHVVKHLPSKPKTLSPNPTCISLPLHTKGMVLC
jgi:hypothetical protein